MRYLYFVIDLCTVIVPLLFSFHPKIKFYREWKWFLPANILTAIIFIIWDIFFTRIGIWGFNEKYITGVYFYDLPIEEILFFVCIPYACVFTYYCLSRFYKIKWNSLTENIVVGSLSMLLMVTGIYFYQRLYTSIVFISLPILIIVIKYFFKKDWLDKLLIIYPLLLIPFFIVNGILTGTGLEHPVVWYNDNENMGLRLLTIPVEDIFYGFELILLNIFFYKLFRSATRVGIAL